MAVKKKVMLRELQSLLGTLNFARRAIAPGHLFLRRLINLSLGHQNPRHFVRINNEARKDISVWLEFLQNYNGATLCLSNPWLSSNSIQLYSDASGAGFAAVYGQKWIQGRFPMHWMPMSIAVKELLPIVLTIELWGTSLANKLIVFMCDNYSVVHAVNKQTCRDCQLMTLIRKLVVSTLTYNIMFRAKHIPGKHNVVGEALSRFQLDKARRWAPWLDATPQVMHRAWHSL